MLDCHSHRLQTMANIVQCIPRREATLTLDTPLFDRQTCAIPEPIRPLPITVTRLMEDERGAEQLKSRPGVAIAAKARGIPRNSNPPRQSDATLISISIYCAACICACAYARASST